MQLVDVQLSPRNPSWTDHDAWKRLFKRFSNASYKIRQYSFKTAPTVFDKDTQEELNLKTYLTKFGKSVGVKMSDGWFDREREVYSTFNKSFSISISSINRDYYV